jgi:hypothetical protein
VGQGYQKAHIEGTKALLKFLPLSFTASTNRSPLRDAFLRAAAMLLCVPERYSQVLDQLDLVSQKDTPLSFTPRHNMAARPISA